MKLDELLSSRRIAFERLHHRPTYTADRMAQMLHVRGREVAKPVLLRSGNIYVLAVLPATHQVDLERVRQALGQDVQMATEDEMERVFPDCERGSMPPFGSLYHLQTLVDESLAADEQIVFENQSHEEAIRMSFQDYEALEHPRKGRFAYHR